MVLGYRNPRRRQELAARSKGRVRVVDDASAYFRPTGEERESLALSAMLKTLLQSGMTVDDGVPRIGLALSATLKTLLQPPAV